MRWRNRWLRIDASHAPLKLAKRTVRVREKLDGTLLLDYQGERLTCQPIGHRPAAKGQEAGGGKQPKLETSKGPPLASTGVHDSEITKIAGGDTSTSAMGVTLLLRYNNQSPFGLRQFVSVTSPHW